MKRIFSIGVLLGLSMFTGQAVAGSVLGPRILEEKFNPPRTAQVGVPYSYVLPAEDPEGEELTFTILFDPPDMGIDPATGEISWLPKQRDKSCTVTVEVSDRFKHRAVRTWGIILE